MTAMELNEPRHREYSAALRRIYADGLATSDELAELMRLRMQLGISGTEADQLLEQTRPSVENVRRLAKRNDLDGLFRLLGHPDTDIHEEVRRAVGAMSERKTADRLVDILVNSEDSMMQRGAAAILADIASIKALIPFSELLEHPNRYLRREASRGLSTIVANNSDNRTVGSAANWSVKFLSDEDPVVRSSAMKAMRYMITRNERAVAYELVRHVDDGNSFVRKHALDLFEDMGETSLGAIVKHGLKDDNFHTRRTAMDAIGRLNTDKGQPYLLEGLSNPDYMMRYLAAKGLSHFRTREATLGLISSLEDRHPHVRRRAARSLACHGAEVVPQMRELLDIGSPKARIGAVNALAMLDDPAADEALEAALHHNDPKVQVRAIRGLVRHYQVDYIEAIRELEQSPVRKVAEAAIEAVQKFEEFDYPEEEEVAEA